MAKFYNKGDKAASSFCHLFSQKGCCKTITVLIKKKINGNLDLILTGSTFLNKLILSYVLKTGRFGAIGKWIIINKFYDNPLVPILLQDLKILKWKRVDYYLWLLFLFLYIHTSKSYLNSIWHLTYIKQLTLFYIYDSFIICLGFNIVF